METRRMRRRARRHSRRTVVLVTSVAVTGVGVGMAVPRNTAASVLLVTAAACCCAAVVLRDESVAPLHGLHHVVRLPFAVSVSATVESWWSRVGGSVRAALQIRLQPTPLVLDEPDDEAAAWWGTGGLTPVFAAPMQSAHVPAPDIGTSGGRDQGAITG